MEKENSQKIINKVNSFFKERKGVLFCYLFGSFATESFNSTSDVDVAVFLDEEQDKDFFKKRILMIEELEGFLKKPVEIVILNEITSIFFKFVIIKEGKLVLEKNQGKRIEFESKVMRDYYDFKPFSEEYNKAYIKRELSKTN